MSKIKKGLYDVLRGRFLTDDSSLKNWRMVVFIVCLLLFMISSAHKVDSKVLKIGELNKKRRELRAQRIDAKTRLMRLKMGSAIKKKVKVFGLVSPRNPPEKIKVIYKK